MGIPGPRLPWLSWWRQFSSQRSWVRQRDAWLPVSRAFAAALLLELDHQLVPPAQPGSGRRMLSGDDPRAWPGEPAERGSIGIG